MEPKTDGEYKKLLTELIKKQIVILGPNITLARARGVKGLEIDEEGNVLAIIGNPKEVLQEVINQFVDLSGMIVKKAMESVLTNYPALSSVSNNLTSFPNTASINSSPQPEPKNEEIVNQTPQEPTQTPQQTVNTAPPQTIPQEKSQTSEEQNQADNIPGDPANPISTQADPIPNPDLQSPAAPNQISGDLTPLESAKLDELNKLFEDLQKKGS